MNNEIQIFSNAAAPGGLGTPELFPNAPGAGHGAAPQHAAAKIHRLLRGRYPLAISLALVFGTVGAVLGWHARKQMWPSTASIQIKSTVPDSERLAHPDVELPGYFAFIKAQILALSSPDVIRTALQKPEWLAIRPGGEDQVNAFSSNLEVTQDVGSDLVTVKYSDLDPAAAKAGVDCLCQAYLEWYQSHDPTGNRNKKALLEKDRDLRAEDLARLRYSLDQLAAPLGGTYDIEAYHDAQMQELSKRETDAGDAKLVSDRIEAALNEQAAAKANGGAPIAQARTAQDIAQTDANMRDLLAKQATTLMEAHRLQLTYGANTPAVQKINNDLEMLNFEIDQYVNETNRIPHTATPGVAGSVGPVTAADLTRARAEVDRLTAAANTQRESVKKIGALVEQIRQLKDKIAQAQSGYDAKVTALASMDSEINLEGDQVHVLVPASLPAKPEDRRWLTATAGFLGGGFLPVAVLMLISLLDRRFRYSDETETSATGIPLLGILPTLSERNGDSPSNGALAVASTDEETAIAAHCVHQIRTLLQINGPERRVYTVTSATSGDGKTSLTLSLGLSFAASGSRTLLIDADMVGGGLTARLGVRAEHGLLEAMAAGNIDAFVHPTDAAGLSILPVGRLMRRYAGTIAPAAVSRLIAEVKSRYDIVLIDTGPVLGSIEASSVAAAADGVIMCVARGQHRQMSDKALAHLQAIGARLAGVVFNRAEARDFERSVSRTVVHSLPSGNGYQVPRTNGYRMGPIAKAVASSVKKSEEEQKS
jgi:capsular exopolysaccharide synthesis family protein